MASIYYRKVTISATHPKKDEEEKQKKQRKTIRMTKKKITKDGETVVTRMKRK
jgi:hypothetical protein